MGLNKFLEDVSLRLFYKCLINFNCHYHSVTGLAVNDL